MTHKKARGAATKASLASLFELLGQRWALRILWELRNETLSSRGLARRCGGVSPTVLHRRLRELRDALLVVLLQRSGYALSPHGAELVATLLPLELWSKRWGRLRR